MVIIAEGLNDVRSGMVVQDYVADLDHIVADSQNKTDALVVLMGVYHQIFGRRGNDPAVLPMWTQWTLSSLQLYTTAVRLVADQCHAAFIDALAVLSGADWTLDADCCHLNDLGHALIGHAVFQAMATRPRGLMAAP